MVVLCTTEIDHKMSSSGAARKEELKNICENWSHMEQEQYLEMLANFYKI